MSSINYFEQIYLGNRRSMQHPDQRILLHEFSWVQLCLGKEGLYNNPDQRIFLHGIFGTSNCTSRQLRVCSTIQTKEFWFMNFWNNCVSGKGGSVQQSRPNEFSEFSELELRLWKVLYMNFLSSILCLGKEALCHNPETKEFWLHEIFQKLLSWRCWTWLLRR